MARKESATVFCFYIFMGKVFHIIGERGTPAVGVGERFPFPRLGAGYLLSDLPPNRKCVTDEFDLFEGVLEALVTIIK
jgi:hypothetical protein